MTGTVSVVMCTATVVMRTGSVQEGTGPVVMGNATSGREKEGGPRASHMKM